MTQEQRSDQRMLGWLESGPADVPVEPLEAAVDYARTHPRRRLSWSGLRRSVMTRMSLTEVQPEPSKRRWGTALAAVAAVAVVTVVAVGGASLLSNGGDDTAGGGVAPVATSTAPSTPPPAPTPTPSPVLPTPSPLVGDRACVVRTVAGKAGQPGAVDGVGAEARFSDEPGFLAWDADNGVLYFADAGNHAIRMITPDGVVTTVAGKLGQAGNVDGKGLAARFDNPVGVSLWGGQLFIADNGNDTVRMMTVSDGMVTTEAQGLSSPWSVAIRVGWGSAAVIFVGEIDGGAVRYFLPFQGRGVGTLAGDPGHPSWTVDAGFGWPFGMAEQAEDGDVYVVDVSPDRSASALRLVDRKTGATTTLPWDERYGRAGVPWIPASWEPDADTLFLTTFLDNTVVKRASDGTLTLLAGSTGVEGSIDGTGDVARFSGPMSIVGDGKGTLYVVDAYNATVRSITCP